MLIFCFSLIRSIISVIEEILPISYVTDSDVQDTPNALQQHVNTYHGIETNLELKAERFSIKKRNYADEGTRPLEV